MRKVSKQEFILIASQNYVEITKNGNRTYVHIYRDKEHTTYEDIKGCAHNISGKFVYHACISAV